MNGEQDVDYASGLKLFGISPSLIGKPALSINRLFGGEQDEELKSDRNIFK